MAEKSKPQTKKAGRPKKIPNQITFTQGKNGIDVDVSWDVNNPFPFGEMLALLAKGALIEEILIACNELAEATDEHEALTEIEEAFEHVLTHIQENSIEPGPLIRPMNVIDNLNHMAIHQHHHEE